MFRYDDSNPNYVIVYTGDTHPAPNDYRDLASRWSSALKKGERFGIIMVDEPHEEHDHESDDHRQNEAEVTRILNDFRRDYREQAAKINVGYARVMPPEWIPLYFPTPEQYQQAQDNLNRYAIYNWGIEGKGFTDLDEAKAWIIAQFDREPLPLDAETVDSPAESYGDKRIGLYYGSSTGQTEYVADELAREWENVGLSPLEPINIGTVKNAAALLDYDYLILGIPTWNIGELQDDWDILFPQLDTLDFTGKKVAIFGVGDQYGYPDNFLDAIGILGNKLTERGAQILGHWFDEHYEFSESIAFVGGKFMGLGIDETSQNKLTGQRIEGWVAQLIAEFALQPA